MRWNGLLISIAATALAAQGPLRAAVFGSVAAIGGQASDIALDESRGALYIANFTANRIEVLSTADYSIRTSLNVAPRPGAMALSRDSQYLLVAHYGNTTPADPANNMVTLINLRSNARQTFVTGDAPLGVAFLATGRALIITKTSLLLFDPVSGGMTSVSTFANLSQQLPVEKAKFPGEVVQTALSASGDGYVVWGIAGAGSGDSQLVYRYDMRAGELSVQADVSSPSLLPRVSVSQDGSTAMIGWALFNKRALQGRYPNVQESTNITGHAMDSARNTIYGQFPDASQPEGPALAGTSGLVPSMLVMDADNLTVRERIKIPENMVGRAVLDSTGDNLYAISDSGVMILPVGRLQQFARVAAVQEDVLVQTSFCNRSTITQLLTITDPGGGSTDFTITPGASGVTVSPSSGMTPATVKIRVDPSAFTTSTGTTAVSLKITSSKAVNQPNPVRVLVNNPDQDQRGTVVNLPGQLTDLLADPDRNRFYVIRQDRNELLVFDGSSNRQIASFRTATTPTMMSFTNDRRYLMVGHNDSQLVTVYDLDSLQTDYPIALPGGHYARSIAESNGAILVMARDESTGDGIVDQVNFGARHGVALPSLGVFENKVPPKSVLSPSPNGRTILLAAPDGYLMLYSADANTFTASRKDFKELSGAIAASSYDNYVVGNSILNSSLVPIGTLDASLGKSSGFAFVGPGGYMAMATTASAPGVIQHLPELKSATVKAVRMAEAPLLPVAEVSSTGNTSGTGTGGNGSGSVSVYTGTSFTRTVAPLASAGTVIVLTTSGVTVLSENYDSAVAPPTINAVTNAADGAAAVAPGGLISVYGQQMSPVNVATSQIPLPTALGESCLSVNGTPVPLIFVSGGQINAQLPYNLAGRATMSIHTPGGVSNNFYFTVSETAPSVFRSGRAGQETGIATVVRSDNNQLITPTNPVHPDDTIVIYLTGMGVTNPKVDAGLPAPAYPLASAAVPPSVTLGGYSLPVSYAGLVPGSVGLYQINASVPFGVPLGMSIPLNISQGGGTTSLNVRVVK